VKIETYRCDECGALKEQSNHWWAVIVRPKDAVVPNLAIHLQIEPLDQALNRRGGGLGDDQKSLCGRECVQKTVERFMTDAQ